MSYSKTATPPLPLIEESMHVEVVFGSPSKRCSGQGICHVSVPGTLLKNASPSSCRAFPAVIERIGIDGLKFTFQNEDLSGAIVKKQFTGDYFLVEESFLLPLKITAKWNKRMIKVLPGVFPIQRSKDHISITFFKLRSIPNSMISKVKKSNSER